MTTIYIHHDVADELAAELVGGALIALGAVVLLPYPGVWRSAAADVLARHIVLWTVAADANAAMVTFIDTTVARRGQCLVLLQAGVATPAVELDCLPLFDATTTWPTWRSALRAALAVPYRTLESYGAYAAETLQLPPDLLRNLHLPILVAGGALLWALLK